MCWIIYYQNERNTNTVCLTLLPPVGVQRTNITHLFVLNVRWTRVLEYWIWTSVHDDTYYLGALACDWTGSGSRCGSFSLRAAETRLWTFLEGLKHTNTQTHTDTVTHRGVQRIHR